MIYIERKKIILDELNNKGVISLKEISKKINASEITIRRDFEKLEDEGLLIRVSGGAVLSNKPKRKDFENVELSMSQKKIQNIDKKKKVADYATTFVKENECVFVDCGTCMIPLIQNLASKKISIITNNMLILPYIKNPTASIYLAGGAYNSTFEMSVGRLANNFIEAFHFDHCFLGCAGIDLTTNEIYTSNMEGYDIKKTAMEKSKNITLLLDSTKLTKHSLISFANLSDMDLILCDQPNENIQEKYPDNILFL